MGKPGVESNRGAPGQVTPFFIARFIVYGTVTEWLALVALLSFDRVWLKLFFFSVGHALASVLFAKLLVAVVPNRFKVHHWGSFGLFFSFSFFIPIFGALGMGAILIYFRLFQHQVAETEFSSVPMPSYMTETDGPAPGMGEGGAWSRLRAVDLPRGVRLKALMAAGTGSGLNTTRLLQLATSDNDDEIRLLAFNLYDRREKVISAAISTALKALHATTDPAEKASLCRELAFAYWEVLYNGMAKNELADFLGNQAIFYANCAIQMGGDDPTIKVLLGRLYLLKGDLMKAEDFIRAALEQGAHRDRVIPYLAEFAYRKRDFKTLRMYFRIYPFLRYKPGIGPVASFWRK